MTRRTFTEAEIDLARTLRREGASWNAVARALGRRSKAGIRKRLDDDYREQINERRRDYMRNRRVRGCDVRDVGVRAPISPAPASYADLTAAMMGDPPIGRSALDARREAQR